MAVDTLGECALGWEAHDQFEPAYNPETRRKDIPVVMGHGGLPLPLLHPNCTCSAMVRGRLGWKAANVTVPSSG